MNIKKMCAATDRISQWRQIDFRMAEKQVKKLQRRIARAYRLYELGKVAALQERLIHSFSAKALAVKTVSSKRGAYTPGVDGVVWKTDEQKLQAVYSLRRRGYRPRPLRRVYIRKPGGGVRLLSIPTMKDRAMLTLYKFALEPIAEISADPGSCGFRHGRSARTAALRLMDGCAIDAECMWILKVDVESCFDSINHNWLLNHIPMNQKMLSKFLSCGYVDKRGKFSICRGIPQGSSLSSVLCNMTLDGLEGYLHEVCGENVLMLRYADDIAVASSLPCLLVQSVLPAMNSFLSERGLRLSQKKTQLRQLESGITLLGFQIWAEGNAVYSVPCERNISSLRQKVENLLAPLKMKPLEALSDSELEYLWDMLNWIIRGWINYYRNIVSPCGLIPVQLEIAAAAVHAAGDMRVAGLIYRIFHRAEGMEVKNMEHENIDFIESELFNEIAQSFDEPCAIEYLGIAKNAIVDAKNTETALPVFLTEKLGRAYALLDEAQEALYNN